MSLASPLRTFHVHWDIDALQRMGDSELMQACTGESAAAVRTSLALMKAQGKTAVVVGKCDSVGRDGRCLGHKRD